MRHGFFNQPIRRTAIKARQPKRGGVEKRLKPRRTGTGTPAPRPAPALLARRYNVMLGSASTLKSANSPRSNLRRATTAIIAALSVQAS